MKQTLMGLALLLMFIAAVGVLEAAEVTTPETNSPAAPDGWLQVPSHEVVLDIRHKWFEFSARQDACEFLATLINFLTQANYTVRLSDDFIRQEIDYYREYQNQEVPVELSKGLLDCLERSRASGVLDWDCFNGEFRRRSKLHQTTESSLDGASAETKFTHSSSAGQHQSRLPQPDA